MTSLVTAKYDSAKNQILDPNTNVGFAQLATDPLTGEVTALTGPSGGVYPIFFPKANTTAAILACALTAFNAGGGVVKLPAATITLTSSLPLYNGVIYEGTGFAFTQIPFVTEPTGTKLVGDGTFPAFAYNVADLGVAPTNYNTFLGQMVWGAGVRGLTMKNFSYGIKCGALWNAGCHFSEFKDLMALNCGWGYWFENFIECNFEGLSSLGSSSGVGAFIGSGGTALNNGNSTLRKLYGENQANSSILTRGWLFAARGTGTSTAMNALTVSNIQTNNNRNTSTQAATMANASSNITITDGTKFAVDMPVAASASVNGFTATQTYFVTSVAGNVIQLANKVGGTPIVATGNSAINIATYGFAQIEVVGYGNNIIQPCEFTGCDLEGGGTVRAVFQNTQDLKFTATYVESLNLASWQYCLRNATHTRLQSTQSSGTGASLDMDANSITTVLSGPRSIQAGGAQPAQCGQGISTFTGTDARTKSNTQAIYMNGAYGPEIAFNKNQNFIDFSSFGVGYRPTTFASGGSVYGGSTSLCVYSGAGGGNANLPQIVANGDGLCLFISNPSSGTLTLNTQASQTVNGAAGVTTFVMPANSTCTALAANNGGTLFWAIK